MGWASLGQILVSVDSYGTKMVTLGFCVLLFRGAGAVEAYNGESCTTIWRIPFIVCYYAALLFC